MPKIRFIADRDEMADSVANTGLVWARGQTLEVPAHAVSKLLQHPDVWALVDDDPPEAQFKFGLVVIVGEQEQNVVLDGMTDAELRGFVDAHKLNVDKRKKGDALRAAIVEAAAPEA